MKNSIIIVLLSSFICILIGCTAEPTTQPSTSASAAVPTLAPSPAISVQFTEIPISNLIVPSNETATEYDDIIYW